MIRVAGMMWSLAGTVFAGIAIIIVLAVPSFAEHAMQYIPFAAIAGFVLAIPVAFVMARQLEKTTAR